MLKLTKNVEIEKAKICKNLTILIFSSKLMGIHSFILIC